MLISTLILLHACLTVEHWQLYFSIQNVGFKTEPWGSYKYSYQMLNQWEMLIKLFQAHHYTLPGDDTNFIGSKTVPGYVDALLNSDITVCGG